MIADQTNPKVDAFLNKADKWREEYTKLRAIVLESCPELTEGFKWGFPCYMLGDKNVLLIHGFREYCAFLFFKGALLDDAQGMLIRQTENVQASRQIRFAGIEAIVESEPVLKTYLRQAVEVEKAGLEVPFKKAEEFAVPEELRRRFGENPALQSAFEALTPGRRRAYVLYFSEPKQEKTRELRINKYTDQILQGKGLND